MSFHFTKLARVALVSLIALAPGDASAQPLDCNHPSGVGCFEFTVSTPAGVTTQVSGFANAFGSQADGMWYTQLVEPGGAATLMILFNGAATPPIEEYPMADWVRSDATPPSGQFVATGSIDRSVLAVSGLHSVNGTVLITGSSPTEVEGTFTYRAHHATTGEFVTVQGRFKTKNQVM